MKIKKSALMSAAEASKKTANFVRKPESSQPMEEPRPEEIAVVQACISQATKEGRYSVEIDHGISSAMHAMLRSLGYQTEHIDWDTVTVITWPKTATVENSLINNSASQTFC